MGDYKVTRTTSNLVFYTNENDAYFTNSLLVYQVVYVDQGKNGYRFASIKKMIHKIEAGDIQCLNDLAEAMKPDVTWIHTMRRPWLQGATLV